MSKPAHEPQPDPLRREFLRGTASLLGLSWLNLNWPLIAGAAQSARAAMDAGEGFRNLSAADAADLEAIAARIIPSDDTPGAREAGVIWFIDQAMGSFMSSMADTLLAGLAGFNKTAAAGSGHERFAQLPVEGQDAAIAAQQDTGFFGLVRYLTIAGMFALPSYGGNREYIGWKLIGFEHRHAWVPPFGHYDARASEEGSGDE